MSVTITFVDKENNITGSFAAENYKSISQMTEKHGIDIPISCCRGACYVCSCKIKSGAEHIQIDKIMPPTILPTKDEHGKRQEVFTCIAGISSDSLNDNEDHKVILEKRF